jgi:hypothetical protein
MPPTGMGFQPDPAQEFAFSALEFYLNQLIFAGFGSRYRALCPFKTCAQVYQP